MERGRDNDWRRNREEEWRRSRDEDFYRRGRGGRGQDDEGGYRAFNEDEGRRDRYDRGRPWDQGPGRWNEEAGRWDENTDRWRGSAQSSMSGGMPEDWQRDRWEYDRMSGMGRGMGQGEPSNRRWEGREDDWYRPMGGERGMNSYRGMGMLDDYGRASRYGELDEGRFTYGPSGSDHQGAREERGPFRGRGPRDYQRSDERIREDVCDMLTQHSRIDASDITVTVDSGEVTLEGTVDSRHVKHMVEDLADDCPGVKDVHNRLRVDRQDERSESQEQEERTNGNRFHRSNRQQMTT